MQSRPHSMSSWRGPGKAGHYQISPIMGRRPSLTNGCLVVHMQSYTRLDTNLTGTKILMKALMVSAGYENSWEWSPFMIAVNFQSQNYRSACIAGHLPPEQVLNFLLQAPCICGAFQRCARTELFVCITFLFAKSGLQLHGVLSSSLPAVLHWHAWRRFVSTLLSLSNTWSRWCGKGRCGPTHTKYTRNPE